MPEQLLKNFSIAIQQKLYEKETERGHLAVYQTTPFGMMMTLNGHTVISEQDGFFYHEMMTHPALFTHSQPERVAILGPSHGLVDEVLKHPSVNHVACISDNALVEEAISQYFSSQTKIKKDPRVHYHKTEARNWLLQTELGSFDVIIQNTHSDEYLQENYLNYHRLLRADGLFIQPCQSSLLHLKTLRPIFQNIEQAGFTDWQSLNFPQPSYASGWRTLMMATKCPTFPRVREKDVYNRHFSTRYYNFDTHKAALALPEFVREELEG